jgi:hypothetical protein
LEAAILELGISYRKAAKDLVIRGDDGAVSMELIIGFNLYHLRLIHKESREYAAITT